jgi:hypothetical protein
MSYVDDAGWAFGTCLSLAVQGGEYAQPYHGELDILYSM